MTRLIFKASPIALCLLGLAACATTPSYPVKQGYVAPAPVEPKYPVTAPAPPPPPPPPPSEEAGPPPGAQAAPPPSSVESQPLAPVGAPASAAPPPAEPGPPPSPRPQAPPPQAYEPPRAEPPARYIADGKVVEAKGMYRVYTVQKGDHIDEIARDLQTTRAELVEANHLKSPFHIEPGLHLKVPVAKAYVAQPGDTMTAVAKRFDVTAVDLAALNDLPIRGRLQSGMKIALPANYHDHGPVRMAAEAPPPYQPRPAPSAASRYNTPASGPYVPSAAALAAGEAHRTTLPSGPPASGAYAPAPVRAAETPPLNQAAVAAAGKGRFIWPVRGNVISSFGVTGEGRRNDGVDITASQGTVVKAAAAGEVVYAGDQVPGFGNLVLVKHADGWVTAYAHLDKVSVQMRSVVLQGQELGQVGMSGGVATPQLHFEIRYAASAADKAKPINPMLVLPQ